MLDGALQGADAIRVVIGAARERYDRQDFTSPAPGVTAASSRTTPRRSAAGRSGACTWSRSTPGQAQHIAAHYRPLSSLMFFSRVLRESLDGTPYAGRFVRCRRGGRVAARS